MSNEPSKNRFVESDPAAIKVLPERLPDGPIDEWEEGKDADGEQEKTETAANGKEA